MLPGNLVAEKPSVTMTQVEVSVKGKWYTVPALKVNGKIIVVKGKYVKIARVDAEDWLETELENPAQCIEILKNRGSQSLKADLFTFAQKLPETEPKYDYPMELDSIAAIRTSNFKEWWEKLPQESRKNVRRSQKRGVIVTTRELDDDLIRDLMELNNDSKMRQGKPNRHYGKSFEQTKKDQESFPDRRELIWAHHEGELVGFLKMIYRGDIASILQFIPKASQSDKRPANALISKAVELCEARGISHLIFGMFNYGNKREDPLREFKIRNGFEEFLVPRFYIPLNAKGSLCMRANLHKGLVGVLPRGVIAAGVGVRTKLYNVRQSISRCSLIAERSNRNRQAECSNPPAGSNS